MIDPGAFDRPRALTRLERDDFDVVVIGGGITGAGVALDAAARGLRTALVERDDFASGTSSKSSKLIHGGLRYLQQGDVRLVYQALAERQRLRRNAPHLVRILPFLLPMFTKDGLFPRKLARAMGTAMWAYDLTGGARIGKLHKRISRTEAVEHMPTLPIDRLAASYLYYDARADDARLTLALARTAAIDHGAVMANRCGVVGLSTRDGHHVVEVEADGGRIEISTASVVNATGVWSDEIRTLDEGRDPDSIRPAKGVHLTVPWHRIGNDIAVIMPVPKDRRSVFVVPWGDRTYIGTTDTDYDGTLGEPRCTPDDVDYLLGAVNFWLDDPIRPDEVLGTWAGLRPLVRDAGSDRTADLSRRHRVTTSANGVITITGGKLTTYREMAADTIDEVLRRLGDAIRGPAYRQSPTRRLALRGAAGYREVRTTRHATLDVDAVEHLADRYGGEARTLMAMIDSDPTLAQPLVDGLPYLRAEAVYAVRYEMATTIDDVLDRRTRARLLARDASAAAADTTAAILATELGWDETRTANEIDAYRTATEQERTAAELPETALDALTGA